MTWTRPTGTWARWGWPITTLALGVLVISSAWTSYRSAQRAADDLIRGEAHTLRDAVLFAHRPGAGPRADLDSLVAAHREGGLRYAAWVMLDGSLVASGGDAAQVPFEVPASRDAKFVRIGSRVRVYFPPPLPPGAASAGRPRPPTIVMEFEPVVARDMMARALRSLVVAGIVAAVLTASGLAFWRMAQRIAESERRIQEQRHLTVLGAMSAVLAHEIHNPLASLKGHAQLLMEGCRPPRRSAARRAASSRRRGASKR